MKDRKGFVYFITDGTAIKIGFSVFVEGRQQDLQGAHHVPLRIINSFRGTIDDEQAIHRHFAHLNIRGEWFRPSPEIDAFIADLEAGRRLIDRQRATITDTIKGTLRSKIMQDEMPAAISKARRDYTAWLERRKAAGTLTVEAWEIAQRCALDLQILDNMRGEASGSLIAAAATELAKLERAITHSSKAPSH